MNKPKSLRDEIARIVGERPGIVRTVLQPLLLGNTELADEFDLDPKKIANALRNMTYSKQIARDSDGHYTVAEFGKNAPDTNNQPPVPENDPRGTSQVPPPPVAKPPGNVQEVMMAEEKEVSAALAQTVIQARTACEKYIDTLNDPYLEQVLKLLDLAKCAEINYRNMIGQGAP